MKITKIRYYDGALDKVSRLGLSGLFLELQLALLDTELLVEESKDGNSGAVVREKIDAALDSLGGWTKKASGGIDWIKKIRYNDSIVARLGVEVQVSARSDLMVRDVVHFRNSLQEGEIDVGVLVVPSDRLESFLPDRAPRLTDAVRIIESEYKEAMTFPIIVVAIEHDGAGVALPKRKRSR